MRTMGIALIALLVSACSSVQGVVRDKSTGSPIPSALVKIKENSASTDALGHYRVNGAFVAGDTMMVNAPGYNIFTQTLRSPQEIIDVDLAPR